MSVSHNDVATTLIGGQVPGINSSEVHHHKQTGYRGTDNPSLKTHFLFHHFAVCEIPPCSHKANAENTVFQILY